MHWKKSLIVLHKVLIPFANTFIVDDKHYLLNRDNLTHPIQMQLYQKQKKISEFFSIISKIYIKFYICEKKMTLIADVFPEMPAPKKMVR